MNLSLNLLSASGLRSTSPFFSNARTLGQQCISFSQLRVSRSFTSFARINLISAKASIGNSVFSQIMSTALVFKREGSSNVGKTSYSANFTISNTGFYNCTSLYNGGAINVDGANIEGGINNCTFKNNSASTGGALSFASLGGTLKMDSSKMLYSSAEYGAHMFLGVQFSYFTRSRFDFGRGESGSLIHYFLATNSSYTNCHFFNNTGMVKSGGSNSALNLTLKTVCLSSNIVEENPPNINVFQFGIIYAEENSTFPGNKSICGVYTPLPTATPTVIASISSKESIIIITSISLFLLLAVFGVIRGTCRENSRSDEATMMDQSTEDGDGDGIELNSTSAAPQKTAPPSAASTPQKSPQAIPARDSKPLSVPVVNPAPKVDQPVKATEQATSQSPQQPK